MRAERDEAGGGGKVRGSQGERKGGGHDACSPLVCSITIYKADIFPNKSFFSNLVHRTTDKLDVDGSWRTGGERGCPDAREPSPFSAVLRGFLFGRRYIYGRAICVRRRADSRRDDLLPFFDYAASPRIHNRRYTQFTFVHNGISLSPLFLWFIYN